MLKLINFSTYESDTERFNNCHNKMLDFLQKYNLDGFEIIQYRKWEESIIPQNMIKGLHMRYYPIWLDFWNSNEKQLIRQFGTINKIKEYYGGTSRQVIINCFKNELLFAKAMKAEYVVFHVSHVELEDTFTYNFKYTDEEVINATIEIINEVFTDDINIKLLFENLWWPGLTLLDNNITNKLLNEVKYKNKGIMLDTAHLINTNYNLKNEKEAINYILEKIENLGELKQYIKGIHLNFSLSGQYVSKKIKDSRKGILNLNIENMYPLVYEHISNIDWHKPFTECAVSKIIDAIKPEYVVYEFITRSLEELEEFIQIQDRSIKNFKAMILE